MSSRASSAVGAAACMHNSKSIGEEREGSRWLIDGGR